MALEIRRPKTATAGLIADRRLYLARDGTRIVEEGSPDAAYLLATPGTLIEQADVEQLGLAMVDDRIVQRPPTSEPRTAGAPEPPPKSKR
jgi:hypothetical protein